MTYFCTDRNGRVDWVRNDKELSIRRMLSSGLGQVTNDRGIGLEKV